MTTYAEAGVNIELGDDVSKILYNAAKQTWENRKGKFGELFVPNDDFSGARAIKISDLPKDALMNMGSDGIGTKVELAERLNNHRTMAYDLFAMVCDDAVVRGAEPVMLTSILDVRSLGSEEHSFQQQIRQLAQGYVDAAKAARVAVVNGEVAELGSRVAGYGEFNYNWGANVAWFARESRLFTGKEIQAGDYLVGLRETGFRSNGLSLVRKIMSNNFGHEWHKQEYEGSNLGEQVMIPSRIYCAAVCDMFGGFLDEPKVKLHGVAHITGGGIPGKLGRMLKSSGLGAEIYAPFEPSPLMKYSQQLGNVTDEQAYKTWNMGQGMILATPEPHGVIKVAKDHGIEAKIIGFAIVGNSINITSKGYFSGGKRFTF